MINKKQTKNRKEKTNRQFHCTAALLFCVVMRQQVSVGDVFHVMIEEFPEEGSHNAEKFLTVFNAELQKIGKLRECRLETLDDILCQSHCVRIPGVLKEYLGSLYKRERALDVIRGVWGDEKLFPGHLYSL